MRTHIANYRYVVIGEHIGRGRRPIAATNNYAEARYAKQHGRTVDGEHWTGVRIHDRREDGLTPRGGWDSAR